ncbi:hypothetical protein D7S81_34760 [Ralstonia insidiosa]|nr:hypothetical protein [Ralstonia insidiosa]
MTIIYYIVLFMFSFLLFLTLFIFTRLRTGVFYSRVMKLFKVPFDYILKLNQFIDFFVSMMTCNMEF